MSRVSASGAHPWPSLATQGAISLAVWHAQQLLYAVCIHCSLLSDKQKCKHVSWIPSIHKFENILCPCVCVCVCVCARVRLSVSLFPAIRLLLCKYGLFLSLSEASQGWDRLNIFNNTTSKKSQNPPFHATLARWTSGHENSCKYPYPKMCMCAGEHTSTLYSPAISSTRSGLASM